MCCTTKVRYFFKFVIFVTLLTQLIKKLQFSNEVNTNQPLKNDRLRKQFCMFSKNVFFKKHSKLFCSSLSNKISFRGHFVLKRMARYSQSPYINHYRRFLFNMFVLNLRIFDEKPTKFITLEKWSHISISTFKNDLHML